MADLASLQPLITALVTLLLRYLLFGIAAYHGVRCIASAVCSNGQNAREHGCVALAFVVAGMLV